MQVLKHTSEKLTEEIQLYGSLALTVIGFILNVLCVIIFCRMKSFKSPTGMHLIFIAVIDNVTLVGLFVLNKNHVSSFETFIPNIMLVNKHFCKCLSFLGPFGLSMSSFLLASATVQRYVSIAFPLKVHAINLQKLNRFLFPFYAILGGIYGGISVHKSGFTEILSQNVCYLVYDDEFQTIELVVYYFLSCIVCLTIILVSSFLIAICLYQYKVRRNALSSSETTDSNKEFRISFMLFIVAVIFLVTRLPELIVYQILNFYAKKHLFTHTNYKNSLFIFPITLLFLSVNHAVNFCIYFGFFGEFKMNFVSMFKRKEPTALYVSRTSGSNLPNCDSSL